MASAATAARQPSVSNIGAVSANPAGLSSIYPPRQATGIGPLPLPAAATGFVAVQPGMRTTGAWDAAPWQRPPQQQQQWQQQQQQQQRRTRQAPRQHATTVFDLVSLPASGTAGAGIVQAMPPRAYDLYIDGSPYSVIALDGLGESDYLRSVLAERPPGTVPSIDLACGGGVPTPRVRDAAFLLMAYGITSTSALDVSEQLCLLDIALAYALPLAFGDWLAVLAAPSPTDGLPSKVRDVASLSRVVDAVSGALPAALALAPGATIGAVARSLARCALGALLRSPGGDAPEPMTAVLLTLAAARGPSAAAIGAADSGTVTALMPMAAGQDAAEYAWNTLLIEAFGEAYALDRNRTNPLGALPVDLTASQLALIAEPAIIGAAPLYDLDDVDTTAAAAVTGGGGIGQVSAADEVVVEARVRRFYANKASALAERVREAVAALIGRWLAAPAGTGADLVVAYPAVDEPLREGALALPVAATTTTTTATSLPFGSLRDQSYRQAAYNDVRYEADLTTNKAIAGAGEGDAFYSFASGATGATATAPGTTKARAEAPLREMLGGRWTRVDVHIGPANLAAVGLTAAECARPDVLLPAIGWPLPVSASPYAAPTCTVGVDVAQIVSSLPADRVLRASLASAASP